MKLNIRVLTAFVMMFIGFAAYAQQQEQPDIFEQAEMEADRLQRLLYLEDWQTFYVDSILKHDYSAMLAEYEQYQKAKVSNPSIYQSVQDKWKDKMDEAFRKYRLFFYEYHRHGLDEMINNVANARARIVKEIPVIKEAYHARPATYLINTFLDAKSEELVNIFEQGTTDERKLVYGLLMDIDPTRQSIYDRINR